MIRFNGIAVYRRTRTILHAGQHLRLPPMMFRLACTLLLARPKTAVELFDLVYADDPEGGPLHMGTIRVTLRHLEPRLAAIGIELRREGSPRRYSATPAKLEVRRAAA
jgi:hypothetical protein